MKATKSDTDPRRNFIRTRLEAKGKVTFKEIYSAFADTDRASIHSDYRALQKIDPQLVLRGPLKERYLATTSHYNITTKSLRQSLNQEAKSKIAWLMGAFLVGPEEGVRYENETEKQKSWLTRAQILGLLGNRPTSTDSYKQILEKLRRYWSSPQRSLTIDAGTSTEAIALEIKDIRLPQPDLTHLYLYTNSRGIFDITGRPECLIKTVVFGGEQQRRTESICGALARKCLEAWNPRFGISIVGTTVIDSTSGQIGCFSDTESEMKAALLSRGSLRIIVADSTKFQNHPMGAMSAFSTLSESLVDLVITDTRPDEYDEIMKRFSVPILAVSDVVEAVAKSGTLNAYK